MTGQTGPHGRFGQLTFTSFDDGRGPVRVADRGTGPS